MTTEVREDVLWRREEKEEEGGILQILDPCVSAVAVSLEITLIVVVLSVVVVLGSEDYFTVCAISIQTVRNFQGTEWALLAYSIDVQQKKGHECEGAREHKVDRRVHNIGGDKIITHCSNKCRRKSEWMGRWARKRWDERIDK